MYNKASILFFSLILLGLLFLMSPRVEGKTIPESWVFSTVHIENLSTKKGGTGFLVSRKISKDSFKIFLISSKHLLKPKPLEGKEGEQKEAEAQIFLNRVEGDQIYLHKFNIVIRDKEGNNLWRGHPNEEIDVAAYDITNYISKDRKLLPYLKLGFIREERFITKQELKERFVSVGDDAIMLGYPLNLVEEDYCFPIARHAVIATKPDYNFRKLPIFLIDSTTIRGSSGSPVFLPVLPYKWEEKNKVNTLSLTQSGLIGIVSGLIPDWQITIEKTITFGAKPQKINIVNTANLGIVYRTEVISETLDTFGILAYK